MINYTNCGSQILDLLSEFNLHNSYLIAHSNGRTNIHYDIKLHSERKKVEYEYALEFIDWLHKNNKIYIK